MNKSYIVIAYCTYLPIVIALTWYVAQTLFKNGLVFMRDIFHGREEIAKATNSLFKIGFWLLNIGYAFWILTIYGSVDGYQDMIEVLSHKIGGFSIYLGIMLFFNLFLFFRGKKVSKEKHLAGLRPNN